MGCLFQGYKSSLLSMTVNVEVDRFKVTAILYLHLQCSDRLLHAGKGTS